MATVTISPDQNTLTVDDKQFKFNKIRRGSASEDTACNQCDAFKLCCELEDTVESSFPFPCVDRSDGKAGNFLAG